MKLKIACESGCGFFIEFDSEDELKKYLLRINEKQVGLCCPVCGLVTHVFKAEEKAKDKDPLAS